MHLTIVNPTPRNPQNLSSLKSLKLSSNPKDSSLHMSMFEFDHRIDISIRFVSFFNGRYYNSCEYFSFPKFWVLQFYIPLFNHLYCHMFSVTWDKVLNDNKMLVLVALWWEIVGQNWAPWLKKRKHVHVRSLTRIVWVLCCLKVTTFSNVLFESDTYPCLNYDYCNMIFGI